jgi:hypothetical protein
MTLAFPNRRQALLSQKTHLEYGGYFIGQQRHIPRHNGHVIRRVPIGGGLDLLPVADLAGVAPLAHEDVLLFESLGAELEVVLHAHHVAFPQHLENKAFQTVIFSVGDLDPHVFGPPGQGYGYISQRHGSGYQIQLRILPLSHKGVERTEIMTEDNVPACNL